MKIQADRRSIEVEEDPATIAAVEAAGARLLEASLSMARALVQAHRNRCYVPAGARSAVMVGVEYGRLSPERARELLDLGLACEADERVDRAVRERRLEPTRAAALAPVLVDPRYQREGDDWMKVAAEARSTRKVRDVVRRRIEEVEQGSRHLVGVRLELKPDVVEHLRRARVIVSRREGRVVTEGETVGAVLDDFLERHDPLRQEDGTRRTPETHLRPESRYIPREVRRAVIRRSRDRCECCGRPGFLQFAHLRPHREGSGREAWDLARLCPLCHLLYDAGYLQLESGWPDAPQWIDAWGHRRGEQRGAPPEQPPSETNEVREPIQRWGGAEVPLADLVPG